MQQLQLLRDGLDHCLEACEACADNAVAEESYVLQSGECSRLWVTLGSSVYRRTPAI